MKDCVELLTFLKVSGEDIRMFSIVLNIVLLFWFVPKVCIADHIHSVYVHLMEQMSVSKPGSTPVKRRGISTQQEVRQLSREYTLRRRGG